MEANDAPSVTNPRVTAAEPPSRQKVRVFISYAAADSVIARVLDEELRKTNNDRVECFFDTKNIGSGRDYLEVINKELEAADWLVCIYTGEQSEFCGYEIGVFSKVNRLTPATKDSRLVCLHDVAKLPAVFNSHQNRLVEMPPDTSGPGGKLSESDFYSRSQLAQFFSDLHAYKSLYVVRDAGDAQRQLQTIVSQAKAVTEAFAKAAESDVRSDTPTQLRIEVSVSAKSGQRLSRIPIEAEVSGTYQSLGLFGLMPPMYEQRLPTTTWGAVREMSSSPYRRVAPWIDRLERDMLDAAASRVPGGLEATFSSKDKIYRTILARHILYKNGDHRFEVLFVETLPRQFLGKRHTSLILAGLVLASRFRFAYLEEPDVTAAKFADQVSDGEFEGNCWQLYYDLDRLQHEAVELGLLDPLEFVKAFGEEKRGFAEQLLKSSAEARERLFDALPEPGSAIEPRNRVKVRDAVQSFLRDVQPVNSRFLTAAMDVYREEMLAQLGAQRIAGG